MEIINNGPDYFSPDFTFVQSLFCLCQKINGYLAALRNLLFTPLTMVPPCLYLPTLVPPGSNKGGHS